MFDLTVNLDSLQFGAGLAEDEKKMIYLRSRCAAYIECTCAHAVFYCKLAQGLRTSISMLQTHSDVGERRELTVGIIGGGHLGKQLVRALRENCSTKTADVKVSSRRPETLEELTLMGVECFYDNPRLASWADVLFLCCLPCHLPQVCSDIRAHLPRHCVIYSLVSTVTVKRLSHLLGHTSILRPAYEFVSFDAERQQSPPVTATLRDGVLIAATCPFSMSCGMRIGAGWPPAVLYSLLNMCNPALPSEGALDLLNQLLGLQFDSVLLVYHFISQSCVSSQSPFRPLPWFSLIDAQSRDTPLSWHLSRSPALQNHLGTIYHTTLMTNTSCQSKSIS